jgi:hypothetical protein
MLILILSRRRLYNLFETSSDIGVSLVEIFAIFLRNHFIYLISVGRKRCMFDISDLIFLDTIFNGSSTFLV